MPETVCLSDALLKEGKVMQKNLLQNVCLCAIMLLSMGITMSSWAMQGKMAHAQQALSAGVQKASSPSSIGSCPVFPANNIWNYDISNLPVAANSANYIASMGLTGTLHAYFGATVPGSQPWGIPYVKVPRKQPYVPINFTLYGDQSDPGPYPIPPNAPIEGGSNSNGDRHTLVIDKATCMLYELWLAYPQSDGSWDAGSGAVWDLHSNHLRPLGWTSADAAGLPIFPGLVRYDEVASGVISHALRVTAIATQCSFLWPARHYASTNCDPNLPPMGLRLRLKASVDISSFPPDDQVILTALKHYGMFVADNGGDSWALTGAPNAQWNNNDLLLLRNIPGSDFEAVDESALQLYPNSGEVNPAYLPAIHPTQQVVQQFAAPPAFSSLTYSLMIMDLWDRRSN
jgi:hypothetical protein